jgi:protoporphyrin/coproporphyrin ferrochelatase
VSRESNSDNKAVLLVAHGSPDSVDEVPEFLLHVTGGRPLPPEAIHEVKHRYGLIGRSPLTELTLKQGELLARELELPVYVGMRNWKPFIASAIDTMTRDQVSQAVVICLAPHNSRTSVGLYRSALSRNGQPPFVLDFVDCWHDHPLLIKAFSERLCAAWERACREAGAKIPVIFTAHSVPLRTIAEGDPYETQAKETAALVAREAALPASLSKFAFQSQGMAGGAWLGPTVEDTIGELGRAGHKGIFIQPIGFLCDHVEVLYDIDIGFKQFAEQRGMRLWRAESLNDSPWLVKALADIARSRMAKPAPNL